VPPGAGQPKLDRPSSRRRRGEARARSLRGCWPAESCLRILLDTDPGPRTKGPKPALPLAKKTLRMLGRRAVHQPAADKHVGGTAGVRGWWRWAPTLQQLLFGAAIRAPCSTTNAAVVERAAGDRQSSFRLPR